MTTPKTQHQKAFEILTWAFKEDGNDLINHKDEVIAMSDGEGEPARAGNISALHADMVAKGMIP